jgi:hypothetical protein
MKNFLFNLNGLKESVILLRWFGHVARINKRSNMTYIQEITIRRCHFKYYVICEKTMHMLVEVTYTECNGFNFA